MEMVSFIVSALIVHRVLQFLLKTSWQSIYSFLIYTFSNSMQIYQNTFISASFFDIYLLKYLI